MKAKAGSRIRPVPLRAGAGGPGGGTMRDFREGGLGRPRMERRKVYQRPGAELNDGRAKSAGSIGAGREQRQAGCGRMFLFVRNRLSGSHAAFAAASRARL